MTNTLGSYLRRRMIGQTVGILAVLTALMQLLELLDITTDVLERKLGLRGVFHYALLRLPSELMVSLPLATLLGTMTALYGLARSREIIAMRSAGVSLSHMLLQLFPVTVVVAAIYVCLSQALIPTTESRLAVWWDETAPPPDNAPEPTWAHTRDGPVSFERRLQGGTQLTGLHMYFRGDDRLLRLRTIASSAHWNGSFWQLRGIKDLRVDHGIAVRSDAGTREWHTNLRPDDVMRLDVAQPYLSSVMLADVIGGQRVGSQPLSYYRTILLRSYVAPCAIFLMLLLAIPPATVLARAGAGSGALLVSLALGLGFLLCDGIMSALGTSGQLRPIVAALAAPLVFAAIGGVQLALCERA